MVASRGRHLSAAAAAAGVVVASVGGGGGGPLTPNELINRIIIDTADGELVLDCTTYNKERKHQLDQQLSHHTYYHYYYYYYYYYCCCCCYYSPSFASATAN